MITNKNKELTQWVLKYCLDNGCQEAKVVLYEASSSSFNFRDTAIETLQQSSEVRLGLYLYVDGRFGSFATNRLDKQELGTFVVNSIAAVRFLAPDIARKLPNSSRYYQGGLPNLDLYDSTYPSIHPDKKIDIAARIAEEVVGKDNRVISVTTAFSDRVRSSYMVTSNGFEGATQQSSFSVMANVSAKGEDEARPSDYWFDSSIYFNKLIIDGIGTKALERTLRKLGQSKIKSGKYPMVLDSLNASRLLSPILRAVSGPSLQQKNSFLLDSLGKPIGSNLFNLKDTPHLMRSNGARYFDGEGVATQPRSVVSKGVLKNYFIDTYSSHKMKIEPTISSPSILELERGDTDLIGLISKISFGVLITGFNGGNCNTSTGDFSFGVEGFVIEQGELTYPISEMNITGNMIELWSRLIAVGNDPMTSTSWRIPSLVFENVSFSGL